jgi:dUTP pyrophosphatase
MKFKSLSKESKAPEKGSKQSAGYDIFSVEKIQIAPLSRAVINTGIILEIPDGYYGRVAPRSGLAVSNGIDVLAGVIDADYRGEIKIVLFNTDIKNYFNVEVGDKIAQIIFEKYFDFSFDKEETLSQTVRNTGGFGSTDNQNKPTSIKEVEIKSSSVSSANATKGQ